MINLNALKDVLESLGHEPGFSVAEYEDTIHRFDVIDGDANVVATTTNANLANALAELFNDATLQGDKP